MTNRHFDTLESKGDLLFASKGLWRTLRYDCFSSVRYLICKESLGCGMLLHVWGFQRVLTMHFGTSVVGMIAFVICAVFTDCVVCM